VSLGHFSAIFEQLNLLEELKRDRASRLGITARLCRGGFRDRSIGSTYDELLLGLYDGADRLHYVGSVDITAAQKNIGNLTLRRLHHSPAANVATILIGTRNRQDRGNQCLRAW
jgi:hypothetical protein